MSNPENPQPGNSFELVDISAATIQTRSDPMQAELMRRPTHGLIIEGDYLSQAYNIDSNYTYRRHDTIDGATTNLQGDVAELDNTLPRIASQESRAMSPRAIPRDGDDRSRAELNYKPRRMERLLLALGGHSLSSQTEANPEIIDPEQVRVNLDRYRPLFKEHNLLVLHSDIQEQLALLDEQVRAHGNTFTPEGVKKLERTIVARKLRRYIEAEYPDEDITPKLMQEVNKYRLAMAARKASMNRPDRLTRVRANYNRGQAGRIDSNRSNHKPQSPSTNHEDSRSNPFDSLLSAEDLRGLDTIISDNIRQAVQEKRDESGVDRLSKDEFREVVESVRKKSCRDFIRTRFGIVDAPDDMVEALDQARRKVVQPTRKPQKRPQHGGRHE